MMLRASTLFAVATLTSGIALADVYRCVDKDVVTYQDVPCGKQPGTNGGRVAIPESPPPKADAAKDLKELRSRVDAMARERRQREIAAEIADIERAIARLNADEAAELAPLRDRQLYIATNLQGDPYGRAEIERQIAATKAEVTAKYREKTDKERRRIVALRAEASPLSQPPRQ